MSFLLCPGESTACIAALVSACLLKLALHIFVNTNKSGVCLI